MEENHKKFVPAVAPTGKSRGLALGGQKSHRSSWAGTKGKVPALVRVGDSFVRTLDRRTQEIARVTGFSTDAYGISHVKFDVTFRRPFSTNSASDSERLLASEMFLRLYRPLPEGERND